MPEVCRTALSDRTAARRRREGRRPRITPGRLLTRLSAPRQWCLPVASRELDCAPSSAGSNAGSSQGFLGAQGTTDPCPMRINSRHVPRRTPPAREPADRAAGDLRRGAPVRGEHHQTGRWRRRDRAALEVASPFVSVALRRPHEGSNIRSELYDLHMQSQELWRQEGWPSTQPSLRISAVKLRACVTTLYGSRSAKPSGADSKGSCFSVDESWFPGFRDQVSDLGSWPHALVAEHEAELP